MRYKIYSQAGIEKVEFSPSSNSTHTHQVMTENVLNLTFTLFTFVDLDVNDYILINGDKYTLLEAYKPKCTSTVQYEYNVKFYGVESELKKAQCLSLNGVEIETSFSLTDTPAAHLSVIVENINRIKGSVLWHIGAVIESDPVTVEYNSITCFEALTAIASAFSTEWWIDGYTINLTKCERGTQVQLGYGQGLLPIEKQVGEDSSFFTRLIPLGSTKNIVKSNYGFSRLQLSSGAKWVEQNVSEYGIIERVEEDSFADIFPHFDGAVGTVRTDVQTIEGVERTIYYYTDPSMTFNPNDYMISGLIKHVIFKSGDLNGQDFEANWNNTTHEWELINQYPDETSQLPGDYLIPRTGDIYTIYNIEMPASYVISAEQEFLNAVNNYLAEYAVDMTIYKSSTDHVYLENNNISLMIGSRVQLISDNYFPTGVRDSRVTKITRKLTDLNSMEIEFSNVIIKGTLTKLQNEVKSLRSVVRERLSTEIINIIKSYQSADMTDENVLSSLRVLREIAKNAISRLNDDTVAGLIKFVKGIEIGNYSTGFLGSGGALKMVDGKSVLEVDDITARRRASFFELLVQQLKHVGGELVLSPASMICNKVEEADTYYRCYFDRGATLDVNCEFVVNDQARCQVWNGTSPRYYWRLVVGTGIDYIDLSKADCDAGSDIPAAGDHIVQLGHRMSDVNGKIRQSAQILSSYGPDAPSYKQYSDISGYTMEGHELTKFARDGNRIVGTLSVVSGSGNIVRVPADRGQWQAGPYYYYDRVSNNGSLWLCIVPEGQSTTETPATGATYWVKQVAQGAQGPQGATGAQGPQGATGATLYTWIKYATSAAGAGLSDSPTGMTYIGLAYNKTTATESDDPSLYTWSLIKGEQGVAGAPGANGTTTYTWIKYSDNADGTGLYDTPTANTMYIGIAVNKTTPTESPTKTDYVWSKFKGDQGVAGANGTNGINAPQPNLINFSGDFLDTTGWSAMASGAGSAAVTYNNTTGPNLRWVYLSNIPSSLQSGGWLALRNNTNLYLVAGRTYTLTLKIRTDALLNYFQIVIGKNDNSESAYTSTVIQQDYSSPYMTVVRTFTAPTTNSSPYYFRIIPSNLKSGYTSLGVYSVKLEEGTASTPWIESETDKSVAATPYRDVFSITKTYTGNKLCRDVVYNGNADTPVFYMANRDAGTFSGKDLSNYQYWTPFSANFENIATGLLLAVEAYIQNLIAGKLKTAASGARTEIDGDTNTIRIYDSNNKLIGAIARVVGVGGSSFTFFGNDYQGGVAADSIYIQDNDQVNYPVKFDAWLYNHVLKLTCQGLEGKSASVGYTPLVLGSNGQIRSGLEYDTLIFTDSSEQSLNRWQRMVLASNASNRILYLPYTDGLEAGHQILIRKKAAGNIIINPVSESILLTTSDIRTSISVTGSGTLASLIWDGQYWCFNQQTY